VSASAACVALHTEVSSQSMVARPQAAVGVIIPIDVALRHRQRQQEDAKVTKEYTHEGLCVKLRPSSPLTRIARYTTSHIIPMYLLAATRKAERTTGQPVLGSKGSLCCMHL